MHNTELSQGITREAMLTRLRALAQEIDAALATCLEHRHIPESLKDAMAYSLKAGGKRLRPALCLTAASLFAMEKEALMPFACGIECIHTYSLIHDDLPAMDDDDLRRGKPTNHTVYGEAMAILAGDGLLSEAFSFMGEVAQGENAIPPARVLRAILTMARAAGAAGMVGGQALDMNYEQRQDVTLEMLTDMHARKTGALIQAACECGAILAGASEANVQRMGAYGAALGMAFQIADDILDVTGDTAVMGKPAGSDMEQGKTTYVSLVGLEKSRELACQAADDAAAQLAGFAGDNAAFLKALSHYVVHRAC